MNNSLFYNFFQKRGRRRRRSPPLSSPHPERDSFGGRCGLRERWRAQAGHAKVRPRREPVRYRPTHGEAQLRAEMDPLVSMQRRRMIPDPGRYRTVSPPSAKRRCPASTCSSGSRRRSRLPDLASKEGERRINLPPALDPRKKPVVDLMRYPCPSPDTDRDRPRKRASIHVVMDRRFLPAGVGNDAREPNKPDACAARNDLLHVRCPLGQGDRVVNRGHPVTRQHARRQPRINQVLQPTGRPGTQADRGRKKARSKV